MQEIINNIIEMFSYTFLVRAIIVGILVSFCGAMLGVPLVLKKYSMIGDGLSHVGFGALAIATAINAAPLSISLPIVILIAFLLLRISENSKIKGDQAIALISTASLAIGVFVISTTTGFNTDVCNYLFGSILGIRSYEVTLSVILSITVIIIFILCYNRIFAITIDENFARASKISVNNVNMLIAILTACVIVLGMRTMGSLLITSVMIFPAITSMRLFKSFKAVVTSACIVSVFSFMVGMYISYAYHLPSGASISIINIIMFLVYHIVSKLRVIK